MRVMIILAADKKGVVVFGVLLPGFARGLVVASEDEMDGLPTVVEVLEFEILGS